MGSQRFQTPGNVAVERFSEAIDPTDAFDDVIDGLDSALGVVLTSTYEQPGRYTRWDFGFVNPPLSITANERDVAIAALNARGEVLLAAINIWLERFAVNDQTSALFSVESGSTETRVVVENANESFFEEDRSRQPSVFSVLRSFVDCLKCDDSHLGVYGAFGYDLAFQFDQVEKALERDPAQRDLVLFVPDEIIVIDHRRETAQRILYEFEYNGRSTAGLDRSGQDAKFVPGRCESRGDHQPGEYARSVSSAKKAFARGDLFEVVPGRVFNEAVTSAPSQMFRRLRERNPAPFGALMNLGNGEFLISASPEMYVRVEGRRVETCPISGTIARGQDVFGDERAIRELLSSSKEEAELTMCTDVDRNDKSRVCKPESIRVIGRRQIEMYSRLIHTVDHVEGELLENRDGIDAFLAHTWAVTVTGAPKLWAMRFIEENEKSPRAWYGGAIGALLFNGNVNTGLTLRTIWLHDGIASVRAGATLLMDSDPESEERETETKAAALLDAIRNDTMAPTESVPTSVVGNGKRVLLIDHEDSFVHNLAGYLRRTGASVTTTRVHVGSTFDAALLDRHRFDLVVLSPGPGVPSDFGLVATVEAIRERGVAIFGVCLGLQALVEAFGGELTTMNTPQHGKTASVTVNETVDSWLLGALPTNFVAGRYHSLCARIETFPPSLVATAHSNDGVVMALEHKSLPIAGVQFHPESLMTLEDNVGFKIVEAMVAHC